MKKVIEVNVDDLNLGGVYGLVKNVILNHKDGVKIDIAAMEKFADPANVRLFNDNGSDIYYIGYEGNKIKKQFAYYKNLKKTLIENKYDHVHIHSDVANKMLVAALAAKSAGMKSIIMHSHAAGVDGAHRTLKRFIHKMCRPFLKKLATQYAACSDYAAAWMFPKVKSEDIIIINNGVDLDKFRFDEKVRDEQRKELSAEPGKILIGHVGRFCYQKNHEYLVRIMEEIKKRKLNASAVFVGSGPDEEMIKELVKEKNLEDYIIFYGISRSVQNLFMAMDVFVLPSNFEGLPIVGVEAQASGLAVLFSDRITKEAKLTDDVEFLPINECDVNTWADKIEEYAKRDYDRTQAYDELKRRKFSISDTVESFYFLYGEK